MIDHVEFPLLINMHGHNRAGNFMREIVAESGSMWRFELAMPNRGIPPVLNARDSREYHAELDDAKGDSTTEFLVPIQLTHDTTKQVIREAWEVGAFGIKIFPTCDMKDPEFGITDYSDPGFLANLAVAEELGMPCLWHCAKRGDGISFLDAEKVFVEETLVNILKQFPALRSSIEHISMGRTFEVLSDLVAQGHPLVATVTSHHPNLMWPDAFSDRNGTISDPHLACKPPLNTPWDRNIICKAMVSGKSWLLAGTDSAPWKNKTGANPPFGIYCPPRIAIPLYVQTFESYGGDWFEHLSNFAWRNAIDFYGLPDIPASRRRIRLVRETWRVPLSIHGVKPLWAGRELRWRVADVQ